MSVLGATCKSAAACRGRSRYLLRILTALTCGVFLFVFYFVSSVQQQAKLQQAAVQGEQESESQEAAVAGVLARTARCTLPLYWAGQSNNFTVLYNFVPAEWGPAAFNESVTYTTHATSQFLAHAEQVALRWSGPVSVAVYAPADDFADSLLAIQYLRQCRASAIRRHVTFHLFFDASYKPPSIPCSLDEAVTEVDCDSYVYPNSSFQTERRLTYPVNVARNIARISAQTQYVLPSDIELYPSVGLIPMFLDMVAREEQERRRHQANAATSTVSAAAGSGSTTGPSKSKTKVATSSSSTHASRKRRAASAAAVPANATTAPARTKPAAASKTSVGKVVAKNATTKGSKGEVSSTASPLARRWPSPTVYVLPLFEVDKSLPAPETKRQLLALIKSGKAVPFHKFVCPECHRVPKQDDWMRENATANATANATSSATSSSNSMSVLYSTKRHKPFQNWEPIYIGTNAEPLYDERLNWEGMSDKMTQAFEMCLMDYNFSILDNAFLVHAPGIKRYNKTLSRWRKDYVTQNHKLRRQIKKELVSKYSANVRCSL